MLEHGSTYQNTYIDLIKIYMLEKEYQNAAKIAQDGLAKLEGVSRYRSVIADLLAETGGITDNHKDFAKGLEEAFYSSVDLEYILKMYLLGNEELLKQSVNYLDDHKETDCLYIHFF